MDNQVILFLGAGASAAYGMPTTKEFFKEFPIPAGSMNNFYLEALESAKLKTPPDIEDLLEFLEKTNSMQGTREGHFIRKFMKNSHFWQELENLIDFIKNNVTTAYAVDPEEDKIRDVIVPLLDFIRAPADIFTTNYDLSRIGIMEYLHKKGYLVTDGAHDSVRGHITKGGFMVSLAPEGDWYRFFNLHGSIDWSLQPNGEIFKRQGGEHDKIAKENRVMIYPGRKENPKNAGHSIYQTMMDFFIEDLCSCPVMVVVGFSYRDEHIVETIKLGLKNNAKLKVYTICKNEPTCEYYQELLREGAGRVHHIPARLGEGDSAELIKLLTYRFTQDSLARLINA